MPKTPDHISKARQKLNQLRQHWEGRHLVAVTPEQKSFCIKEIRQVNKKLLELETVTVTQRAAGFGGWYGRNPY